MKKLNLSLLILLLSISMIEFTGCKDPEPAHEHTFSDSWSKDATHHWHATTCGHPTEVSGKAAHSFGDWTTTKEATEEIEGNKERSCTICGYKATEVIEKLEHTHTMNILLVEVIEKSGKIVVNEGSFEITPTDDQAKKLKDYIGKEVYFGIRPEDLTYQKKVGKYNNLQMKVLGIERFESDIHVYLATKTQSCVALIDSDIELQIGDTANFTPIMENTKFFDKETELNICE